MVDTALEAMLSKSMSALHNGSCSPQLSCNTWFESSLCSLQCNGYVISDSPLVQLQSCIDYTLNKAQQRHALCMCAASAGQLATAGMLVPCAQLTFFMKPTDRQWSLINTRQLPLVPLQDELLHEAGLHFRYKRAYVHIMQVTACLLTKLLHYACWTGHLVFWHKALPCKAALMNCSTLGEAQVAKECTLDVLRYDLHQSLTQCARRHKQDCSVEGLHAAARAMNGYDRIDSHHHVQQSRVVAGLARMLAPKGSSQLPSHQPGS